jgi:hypothetical protein
MSMAVGSHNLLSERIAHLPRDASLRNRGRLVDRNAVHGNADRAHV